MKAINLFINLSVVSKGCLKTSKLSSKICYGINTSSKLRPILPLHIRGMATNAFLSKSKKEKDNFQDVLPLLIDSLETSPKFKDVPEVGTWIKKVLKFNLMGGKRTRGLTTVFAYEMFENPDNITEESIKLARIMGWCVEMLQAYFLVVDDIMDGSITRRGLPCWYRMPNIGMGAINDSILIYSSIFQILKSHFKNHPAYAEILDLFNETLLHTSMGQYLDYSMAHVSKKDYSLFTLDRYNAIVKYKTAYYTYKLPVCLGLLLTNNTDKDTHHRVEKICLEIGKVFQMQDDYIDCFSDPRSSGKFGTDIQEGKCSWLAVMALQKCDEQQRIEFCKSYGSKDPSLVRQIETLYKELKLPELYAQEEKAQFEAITKQANDLAPHLPPKLFYKLIDMIYKRKQ